MLVITKLPFASPREVFDRVQRQIVVAQNWNESPECRMHCNEYQESQEFWRDEPTGTELPVLVPAQYATILVRSVHGLVDATHSVVSSC